MPLSPKEFDAPAFSLGSPSKARVFVASEERTLFDLIDDPRIDAQRLMDPNREPHIIVLPCSSLDGRYEKAAEAVPADLWRRVAVVFDGSCEGPDFPPDFIEKIHRFIERKGATSECCAFVTQNRNARWPGSQVKLLHYDFFIRSLCTFSADQGSELFEVGLGRFRARKARRPKRFISLNFTARPNKLLFLLALLRDGLWDQGYVSFGGLEQLQAVKNWSTKEVRNRLLVMPGFEALAHELADYLPVLETKGQVLLGYVKRRSDGYLSKPIEVSWLSEYDLSWFSATTETEISATVDRITEKSIKPLLNFHPQVVLGNAGSLKRLRTLGFESFAGWIDEAYDEEPNPSRRFELAYGEVRRLCALDEPALERMEAECAELIVSNARRGLVELPTAYRQTWDPEIVSEILSLLPQ